MIRITQELLKLYVQEHEPTPSVATLLDVARVLRSLGRGEEANYYMTTIPMMLVYKGFNLEDVYIMSVDEVAFELNKPIAPAGWDNTIWGKSLICRQ